MSRRLNHYKETITLFIQSKVNNLQKILYDTVDETITIENKYINKGHTVENTLKRVDKDIQILNTNEHGFLVRINIHIHHYTRLYFDSAYYIILITERLNLSPGSVIEMKDGNQNNITIQPREEKVETLQLPKSGAFA